MVTKPGPLQTGVVVSLILAKIYMVTKLAQGNIKIQACLILAKIYMVTKPQIHNSIYLKTNKS